jgi:drug/metabolite transporter (DMT)-like permease
MSTANLLRLILLAAIWGGSFLFMRISAPVLGPAVLIEYRVGFAAVFLAIVGLLLNKRLDLRANWKHYLMLGMFNSALPFLLFAFAARTLTASVLSVLNATAPMWGALIGAAWSRQRIGPRSALGILCTGIGYIIYFRLIEEVGPTSALTVTFLNPLFGILWGVLFLGETIGWYTVAGAAIVIAGTALVIGIMPRFGARPVPAAAPANP